MLAQAQPVVMIVGLLVEMTGVVLMARQFANVRLKQLPGALVAALFRRCDALVQIAKMSGDRPTDFVQGLGFACLGILIQASATLIDILARPVPH
jgi:hypothetical protein